MIPILQHYIFEMFPHPMILLRVNPTAGWDNVCFVRFTTWGHNGQVSCLFETCIMLLFLKNRCHLWFHIMCRFHHQQLFYYIFPINRSQALTVHLNASMTQPTNALKQTAHLSVWVSSQGQPEPVAHLVVEVVKRWFVFREMAEIAFGEVPHSQLVPESTYCSHTSYRIQNKTHTQM